MKNFKILVKAGLTLIAVACFASASFANGLVAHYQFNGNAADSSGNGHHGIVPETGVTLVPDRFGNPESAYRFDGNANSSIKVPNFGNAAPTEAISVSIWAKVEEAGGSIFFLNKGSSENRINAHIYRPDSILHWDFGDITPGISPRGRMSVKQDISSINQWEHYVFVASSIGMAVYRNGILIVSGTDNKSFTRTATDLLIGDLYKGSLDDMRIYDRVITEEEIIELYTYKNYKPELALSLNTGKRLTSVNPGGQYASVPEGVWFNGDFTVTSFIKLNTGLSASRIFDFGNSTGYDNVLYDPSRNLVSIYNNSNSSTTTARQKIGLNEWTHVAITLKSDTLRIFNNGIKVAETTDNLIPAGDSTSMNYIGRSHWGAEPYFDGLIDEFRLYNKSLTEKEIKEDMYKKLTGKEAGLILYYDFNRINGNKIPNLAEATSGADATLHNGGSLIPAKPISRGLVAYYPFSGNADDASGNNLHGIVPETGVTLVEDRFGNPESAYRFDKTDSIIVPGFGINAPNEEITISIWAKGEDWESGSIFDLHTTETPWNPGTARICAQIYRIERNISWHFTSSYNGNTMQTIKQHIDGIGKWEHYVFIGGKNGRSIYRNGELIAQDSYYERFNNSNIPLLLGRKYKGSLDDIKIYNRVITEAEIIELYSEGGWDLMAHLPFDGDIKDHSIYERQFTSSGVTLAPDRFGKDNSAALFDASGTSHITLTESEADFNTLPLSASFWFNASKPGGLVNKYYSSSHNGINIAIEEGKLAAWYFSGNGWNNGLYNKSIDVSMDTWYHCAVNFGHNGAEIYLNGKLVSEFNWNGNPKLSSSTLPLVFGNYVPGPNFGGLMDDIRVYNRILSAGEINGFFTEGGYKPDNSLSDGLFAHYPLNGNANDISGNNYHGAIKGIVAPVQDRFGFSNSAMRFNSTAANVNNCITIDKLCKNMPTDSISISVWVKTESATNNSIFWVNDTYRAGVHLNWDGGMYWDFGRNPQGRISLVPSPNIIDEWEHYVFTARNTEMAIYRNGIKIASQPKFYGFNNGDFPFNIGYLYTGILDDMRIYSRVISEEEILELYSEGGWPVQQIALTEKVFVKEGESIGLLPVLTPSNAPKDRLVYFSADPKVATINSSGIITGVSEGQTLITVTSENGSARASTVVSVEESLVPITKIIASTNRDTLIAGNSRTFSFRHEPSSKADVSEIHWEAENEQIAKVGSTGNIEAISKGETIINLYADSDKTIKDSIVIVVLPSMIPKLTGPGVSNFLFKATSMINGKWTDSDTLKIAVAQYFEDDDSLSYTFSYVQEIDADTMGVDWVNDTLLVFQTDTAAKKTPFELIVRATDKDEQYAEKKIIVNISEAEDKAPWTDSIPEIKLYQFRKTAVINLAWYITDDYTPFDQLVFGSPKGGKSDSLFIDKGIASLRILAHDSITEIKDTLLFTVADGRGQVTEVRFPYHYQRVIPKHPQVVGEIDTLVQNSGEAVELDLAPFITDEYTPIDLMRWSVIRSSNVNMSLEGSVLTASSTSSVWSGTEILEVQARNEADLNTSIKIPFTRIVDGSLKVLPDVSFTLSQNGSDLPLLVQKGSSIMAELIDNNSAIGINSWQWRLINENNVITLQGGQNMQIRVNDTGNYTVELIATNSSGPTTVTKKNAFTVAGIVASRSLVCRDSVVVLSASDTTAGNQYQWRKGETNLATTASINVSPTETVKYSVAITKGNATVRDTILISVQQPISKVANDTIICGGIGQGVVFSPSGFSSIFWNGAATHAPSYTATAADTVIVEAWIDNKGTCPAVKDTIIVSVYSPIEIGLPDTLAMCRGINDTLIAKGGSKAADYIWNVSHNRGDTLVVSANGTYIVTVTAANGCKYSDSTRVFVNESPAVTALADRDTVCQYDTVQLTANVATGIKYVWSAGVDSTGKAVPTISGENRYTATATSEYGCIATAEVKVAVLAAPNVSIVASNDSVCTGSSLTLTATGAKSYIWSGGITNGVKFTPAASGKYFVTGTSNGCSVIDSITVFVSDLAASTITLNTEKAFAICQNGSVTLTASGIFSSLIWDNGVNNGEAFVPDTTATYIVTGVDVNKCISNESVTVTVNALPVISISPMDTTICPSIPVTLTATGAANYKWDNAVENGIAFSPSATKTYSVTGTDANGCEGTAATKVSIHQTFAEQIGVVTASEDGKSIVIAWEPTKGKHLARYELERFEKIVGDSDSYAKIKTFNATDSSYFVDMNVNQNTQSYKYRLLSFDSVCPAAYTASNVHSSIHLATSTGIEENVVNFQWTPYKGLDINTYYFYAFKNGEKVETETYNVTTEERNSSIVQRSFDRHNKDYKYKIGFVLPAEFSAGRLKSDSGPYSQSLSNLSEALAEGTNLVIAKNGIVIFPVPAQEILYVVSSGELLSATVQSAAGQVILSHTGSSPVDVSRLAPGTYSIKLVTENSEALLQFVKQ
jgi:hypothetical protein